MSVSWCVALGKGVFMLAIEQRHSKLLPGLLALGIFTFSFISSASILYALDPNGSDSVRHTPSFTSTQESKGPAPQDSGSETNPSSNETQDKPNQASSSQAVAEAQPTPEETSDQASSGNISPDPTSEAPTEQTDDTTTTTRRHRRTKPTFDLSQLFYIELNSFLGIRI